MGQLVQRDLTSPTNINVQVADPLLATMRLKEKNVTDFVTSSNIIHNGSGSPSKMASQQNASFFRGFETPWGPLLVGEIEQGSVGSIRLRHMV